MKAFVYILKCSDGSFYTGFTTNIERRLHQHQTGYFEGSLTTHKLPIELVYNQEFPSIRQALAFEKKLKNWSHKKKEALISGDFNLLHQLAECRNETHYQNRPERSRGTVFFEYRCSTCKSRFQITKDLMLCPKCREEKLEGKPLKGVLKVQLPEELRNTKSEFEYFDVFDYLPIEKKFFPNIPVGNTPLIKANRIDEENNFTNLYLKYDGMNPTGSYKDRASYLVSAFAKKFGINEIVLASTGNAASSMAGISACAGQKTFIFMPASAPRAKLVQCLQYGATLIPIDGNYDTAFDLSLKFSELTGYLNRNTAYNPMTIEGKKTSAFELVAQLRCNIDYVFIPVGDGVCLSGIIKGFLDLQFLGLLKKIPKIIGVQAEGSRFIYEAFYLNTIKLDYKADTLADSISVDVARNTYCAIEDLKVVDGEMILVSDEEILKAQKLLAEKTGIFAEPSSSATLAGLLKMKEQIDRDSIIVLMLTGNGLKDIDNAAKLLNFPKPVEPNLDKIITTFLSKNNAVQGL